MWDLAAGCKCPVCLVDSIILPKTVEGLSERLPSGEIAATAEHFYLGFFWSD